MPTNGNGPDTAMPFAAAAIPCSRMPKWMMRPLGSSGVRIAGVLHERAGVAGEVAAAADEAGHDVEDRAEHLLRRDAGRERTSGLPRRELLLPALGAATRDAEVELLRPARVSRRQPPCGALPTPVRADAAAPGRGAEELEDVVGDVEVLVGGEPEDLLDPRDLVGAERLAVRLRRVLELGRRVPDVRAQDEQRRAVLVGHAVAQAALERVEVLGGLTELDARASRTRGSARARRRCR